MSIERALGIILFIVIILFVARLAGLL